MDDEHSVFPNKRVSLGFDANGRLLEVLYNETSMNEITVYHAMPCREKFLKRLK